MRVPFKLNLIKLILMKKFFTTLVVIFLAFRVFASISIYGPTLTTPTDAAVDQMPNVLLNWAPVAGGFGLHYKVQIDSNNLFSNPVSLTTSLTAINASKLIFAKKYYWRVKAYDNTDSSGWSSTRTFTVINNVKLFPMNSNSLQCYYLTDFVEWHQVTGITHYDYQIDTISSFNSSFLKADSLSGTASKLYFPQGLYYNLTYYFRIRARHTLDISDWSATDTFKICNATPNMPELSSPANMSINQPSSVFLDWKPLIGATSYVIQYGNDINFTAPTTVTFIPGTNNVYNLNNSKDSIGGLGYNKTYYWRVRAIQGINSTLWSPVWSFSTIDTLPSMPIPILPEDMAVNVYPTVQLQWTPITNAVSYMIEYGFDPNATDTLIVNTNNLTLHSLLFDSIYFWHVKAFNSTDTSNWSSARSFRVIDHPSLLSPLNNSEGNFLNVPLSWETITGVTNYDVQIDTTISFNSPLKIDSILTASTINLFSAFENTTYFWRVKAMHAADTSSWSTVWSLTTIDTLPNAPILVSPVNAAINANTSLQLNWTSINDATSYMIEYDITNTFATAVSLTATTNSINISNLLFGETYYWRVKALNSADTSNWSNIHSFTVVNSVNLISPANGTLASVAVVLKSEKLIDVSLYEYQIDSTNNFNSTLLKNIVINSDLPVIQAFSSQSLFGTTYFWRVRAILGSDTSGWSNIRSFITPDDATLAMPSNGALDVMPNVSLSSYNMTGVNYYMFELDTTPLFDSFLYYLSYPESSLPFVQSENNELLFGTTYFWRIKGKMGSIFSDWSNVWTFTTISKVVLNAPADGSTSQTANINLKWNAIDGITHYIVEIDTATSFSHPIKDSVIASVNQLTILSNTLLSNKTYYWRVKAVHSKGESNWSDVWSFHNNYNVGINDIVAVNNINMYPNPSKGNVNIEINASLTSAADLQVLDITGRVVYYEKISVNKGLNYKHINLSFLTKGIYIVSIKNDVINFNKKLILNN